MGLADLHRPVGFADGAAHLPADWISRKSLPATLGCEGVTRIAAEVNSAALATLKVLVLIREQQRVYLNFIRALDQFVG